MIRRFWIVASTVFIMSNLTALSLGQHLNWLNYSSMTIVGLAIILWIIFGDKTIGGKP